MNVQLVVTFLIILFTCLPNDSLCKRPDLKINHESAKHEGAMSPYRRSCSTNQKTDSTNQTRGSTETIRRTDLLNEPSQPDQTNDSNDLGQAASDRTKHMVGFREPASSEMVVEPIVSPFLNAVHDNNNNNLSGVTWKGRPRNKPHEQTTLNSTEVLKHLLSNQRNKTSGNQDKQAQTNKTLTASDGNWAPITTRIKQSEHALDYNNVTLSDDNFNPMHLSRPNFNRQAPVRLRDERDLNNWNGLTRYIQSSDLLPFTKQRRISWLHPQQESLSGQRGHIASLEDTQESVQQSLIHSDQQTNQILSQFLLQQLMQPKQATLQPVPPAPSLGLNNLARLPLGLSSQSLVLSQLLPNPAGLDHLSQPSPAQFSPPSNLAHFNPQALSPQDFISLQQMQNQQQQQQQPDAQSSKPNAVDVGHDGSSVVSYSLVPGGQGASNDQTINPSSLSGLSQEQLLNALQQLASSGQTANQQQAEQAPSGPTLSITPASSSNPNEAALAALLESMLKNAVDSNHNSQLHTTSKLPVNQSNSFQVSPSSVIETQMRPAQHHHQQVDPTALGSYHHETNPYDPTGSLQMPRKRSKKKHKKPNGTGAKGPLIRVQKKPRLSHNGQSFYDINSPTDMQPSATFHKYKYPWLYNDEDDEEEGETEINLRFFNNFSRMGPLGGVARTVAPATFIVSLGFLILSNISLAATVIIHGISQFLKNFSQGQSPASSTSSPGQTTNKLVTSRLAKILDFDHRNSTMTAMATTTTTTRQPQSKSDHSKDTYLDHKIRSLSESWT